MVSSLGLAPSGYPELDDTWPWLKLAAAAATIRRIEKLVDKWDHQGLIEAHQLLDALEDPHKDGT